MAQHSFSVGQNVELFPGRNDGADREYRVRNARDGHERVVRESQLRSGPKPLFG